MSSRATYPVYVPGDILDAVQRIVDKTGTSKADFVEQALSLAVALEESGETLEPNVRCRSESLYTAFSKLLDEVLADDTGYGSTDIPDSTFLYLIKLQTDLHRGFHHRNPEAFAAIRMKNANPSERFLKLLTDYLKRGSIT